MCRLSAFAALLVVLGASAALVAAESSSSTSFVSAPSSVIFNISNSAYCLGDGDIFSIGLFLTYTKEAPNNQVPEGFVCETLQSSTNPTEDLCLRTGILANDIGFVLHTPFFFNFQLAMGCGTTAIGPQSAPEVTLSWYMATTGILVNGAPSTSSNTDFKDPACTQYTANDPNGNVNRQVQFMATLVN